VIDRCNVKLARVDGRGGGIKSKCNRVCNHTLWSIIRYGMVAGGIRWHQGNKKTNPR